MRSRPQAGITLIQLLFTAVALFGLYSFAAPRWFPNFRIGNPQVVGAQAYFNHVIKGIENSKQQVAGGELPMAQACTTLTFYKPDPSSVASCLYQPSASQGFYIVTVTGKTGEMFRYAGRGAQ